MKIHYEYHNGLSISSTKSIASERKKFWKVNGIFFIAHDDHRSVNNPWIDETDEVFLSLLGYFIIIIVEYCNNDEENVWWGEKLRMSRTFCVRFCRKNFLWCFFFISSFSFTLDFGIFLFSVDVVWYKKIKNCFRTFFWEDFSVKLNFLRGIFCGFDFFHSFINFWLWFVNLTKFDFFSTKKFHKIIFSAHFNKKFHTSKIIFF